MSQSRSIEVKVGILILVAFGLLAGLQVLIAATGNYGFFNLLTLADEPQRFGAIKRMVPDISQRMLTQTLRDMEASGLVVRRVYGTVPPAVDIWFAAKRTSA